MVSFEDFILGFILGATICSTLTMLIIVWHKLHLMEVAHSESGESNEISTDKESEEKHEPENSQAVSA